MLRLQSKINIGNFEYTTVVNVSVSSSWELFTDTCTIEMPTNLGNESLSIIDTINVGDEITVELGYYPFTSVVFTGFITKIEPKNPIVISCEDYMWKLKQQTIKEYVSNSVTIKELLNSFSLPVSFETVDANLGKIRISNANVTEILNNLKENYGLISYIRDGVLIVGTVRRTDATNTTIYIDGENGTVIEDTLEYQKSNNLDLYIKGVSFQSDNSKIELYAYYEEGEIKVTDIEKTQGEQRVFNYYGLTESELSDRLTEILPNIYYEGYKGTFTTFLRPQIRFGDSVTLKSLKFPERDGEYLVKSVNTTFGESGGRQVIELDLKLG
jgi:hypothetical protein